MVLDSNNLQLTFIEAISRYPDIDFKTSPHFSNALKALSALLATDIVIFSSVYPDENNQETLLKSHLFTTTENKPTLTYFVNKFDSHNLSTMLATMQTQKEELAVDYQQIFAHLTQKPLSEIPESDNQNPFFAVPFYTDDKLVGILAYQAKRSIDFKTKFVASYRVLKSIFTSNFQLERAAIENHTFQTVLDLMPQRVFWKNKDLVYMGCNKAFSQDASLNDPNEIIGVTDYDIFPEQAELYRSDDANTMNTREHLISSEEPQTHKNGTTIWLRTSKRPIINKEDIVIGVVGTYDDITELKNTQEALSLAKIDLENRVEERTRDLTASKIDLEMAIKELKSTQKHLVETEKMASLGTLVAGVSHEINTPLGVAVTGASHLEFVANSLKEKVIKGDISKAGFMSICDDLVGSSDLILRNLDRASELIRNFKMIAVDQSNDEVRPIVVKKYLQDIINAMTPQTKHKNIKIFVTGDDDLSIATYPGTVAQIFTNLIVNTMHHGFAKQDSGEIKITYQVTDKDLTLSFEDNGAGISKDKLVKIFQPFYTTNRAQGGSGLGLSIVFNLVTQRLNGKVTCDSEPNQWTRFDISFPIK